MDRLLYVSMSGATQTVLAMEENTNNMANVSTTGFKADFGVFKSVPVVGEGFPTRVYAIAESTGIDFSSGAIHTTGRELDMAVTGDGWIAVQASDGSEAYTRAGHFQIAAGGLLTTATGYPVLGNSGPITIPPAEKIELGADGTISIRPIGQSAATLAIVDRIKLVNPDPAQMVKGEDGLMHVLSGDPETADSTIRLVSGALEASNVNPVDTLVNMITLSRLFELQIKTMKTAEEMDAVTSQILQLS